MPPSTSSGVDEDEAEYEVLEEPRGGPVRAGEDSPDPGSGASRSPGRSRASEAPS